MLPKDETLAGFLGFVFAQHSHVFTLQQKASVDYNTLMSPNIFTFPNTSIGQHMLLSVHVDWQSGQPTDNRVTSQLHAVQVQHILPFYCQAATGELGGLLAGVFIQAKMLSRRKWPF